MSFEIICGDVLQVLPALPADSVHCCMTSPPYWGLRDYKIEPSVWGGEADCGHRWGDEHRRTSKTRNGSIGKHSSPDGRDAGAGQFCQRCHAWRGALGLEPSIELYVEHTVQVFREVRRVLRPEGTVYLNLGDCYGSGTRSDRDYSPNTKHGYWNNPAINLRNPSPAKQLLMVPERVALALQADGWWVRSRIPWVKHNGMPESVDDRPTSMVEYLFLLAKSERYYYDAEAIKEPAITGDPRKPYAPGQVDARGNGHARGGGKIRPSVAHGGFAGKTEAMAESGQNAFRSIKDWRNKRSVWTVPTCPLPDAHFATFPPKLIEPCILAGCPEGGIVLDPFAGAGTTGLVALQHGRRFVGIELNPAYVTMALNRARRGFSLFLDEDSDRSQDPLALPCSPSVPQLNDNADKDSRDCPERETLSTGRE